MRALTFFKYIFKHFPFLVLLNILILILTGLVESAAILSITPVVDVLINPDLKEISPITRRVIDVMHHLNIPVSIGSLLFVFVNFNAIRSFFLILSNFIILKIRVVLFMARFVSGSVPPSCVITEIGCNEE